MSVVVAMRAALRQNASVYFFTLHYLCFIANTARNRLAINWGQDQKATPTQNIRTLADILWYFTQQCWDEVIYCWDRAIFVHNQCHPPLDSLSQHVTIM